MQLRYMGFDQQKSTRTYQFDRFENGARHSRVVISADLDLFLRNQVSIQEGPVLCAKKLASDLEQLHLGGHWLTNEDLLEFTNARAASQALKAEMRGRQPKRRRAEAACDS
jgi:hypothetical protein